MCDVARHAFRSARVTSSRMLPTRQPMPQSHEAPILPGEIQDALCVDTFASNSFLCTALKTCSSCIFTRFASSRLQAIIVLMHITPPGALVRDVNPPLTHILPLDIVDVRVGGDREQQIHTVRRSFNLDSSVELDLHTLYASCWDVPRVSQFMSVAPSDARLASGNRYSIPRKTSVELSRKASTTPKSQCNFAHGHEDV